MNPDADTPDQGVRDLILEKPELLIEAEEFPFESQTRENKTWPRAKPDPFNLGRTPVEIVRSDKKKAKKFGQKSMPLCRSGAQDQITEVGTKEAEESPLIADMPLNHSVTSKQSAARSCNSFSSRRQKKKEDQFSSTKTPEAVSVLTSDHRKKKWLKSFSTIGRKTSSNRYKKVVCLLG